MAEALVKKETQEGQEKMSQSRKIRKEQPT